MTPTSKETQEKKSGPDPVAREDLEARLAFQEQTLSELNEVIVSQDRRIAHLERQLQALAGQYRRLRWALDESSGGEPPPSDEPPPHY